MKARFFLGSVKPANIDHEHSPGQSATMCPICRGDYDADSDEWIEIGSVISKPEDNSENEGR